MAPSDRIKDLERALAIALPELGAAADRLKYAGDLKSAEEANSAYHRACKDLEDSDAKWRT